MELDYEIQTTYIYHVAKFQRKTHVVYSETKKDNFEVNNVHSPIRSEGLLFTNGFVFSFFLDM
jgi:hypothetical protein